MRELLASCCLWLNQTWLTKLQYVLVAFGENTGRATLLAGRSPHETLPKTQQGNIREEQQKKQKAHDEFGQFLMILIDYPAVDDRSV